MLSRRKTRKHIQDPLINGKNQVKNNICIMILVEIKYIWKNIKAIVNFLLVVV